MKFKAILIVFTVIAIFGCKKSGSKPGKENEILKDDFSNVPGGWSVDFADYPKGKELEWKLEGGIANLPSPLDAKLKGLRVSGFNHSDDLFMFLKKKITGLKSNQTYTVNLEVEFASNAPSDAFGVGGAPGESVVLKAGLTSVASKGTPK
jgi:hypothetical protein